MGQEQLVALAQQGDHEAFTELARASFDRLYRVAKLTLRDTELAEDAVQEALIKAWREVRGLRELSRWDAWTYRLVLNACHDLLRGNRRRAATVALLPNDHGRPTPVDSARELEDRDQLERAFGRLAVDQRAVLVLHYFADLRLDEIADALGIPLGTAKSRLHYGMRALRAQLEADTRAQAEVTA